MSAFILVILLFHSAFAMLLSGHHVTRFPHETLMHSSS